MQAKRAEDIPAILANTKNYPTPVRFVGGDYSQTRCVGGDGGTTVNLSSLGKIVEFGEDEVRAQAGVRVGALVRAPRRARSGAAAHPGDGAYDGGRGGGDHAAAGLASGWPCANVGAREGAQARHAAGQADDGDRAQRAT